MAESVRNIPLSQRVLLGAFALVSHLLVNPSSFAQSDLCSEPRRVMVAGLRDLQWASSALNREQRNLDRTQAMVLSTLSNLNKRVTEAEAYARAVSASSGGAIGFCVVNTILLGYNPSCAGNAAARAIAARIRANALVASAKARRQDYFVFSRGLIRRQAQRVVDAQSEYDISVSTYTEAVKSLSRCEAT